MRYCNCKMLLIEQGARWMIGERFVGGPARVRGLDPLLYPIGRVGGAPPIGNGERKLTDAIIFVPPDRAARPWLPICAAYCDRMGYHVVAVVSDWEDVVRMLRNDGVEVVVVGKREHLPTARPWRVEAVADHTQDTLPSTQRRPHRRA